MVYRAAGGGTAYPTAFGAESGVAAETVAVANVNVIGKADLTTQGTIGGLQVKTCNPGKQAPQNEFSVAVNPANPLNLVAGANDYRLYESSENRYDGSGGFYRSIDGGKKWTAGYLPGLVRGNSVAPGIYQSAGDPAVAAGPNNVFWYANIVFNRPPGARPAARPTEEANGIAVSRSSDGGATWVTSFVDQSPAGGTVFNDKEWIAAHPKNPLVAYVTWTKFTGGSSRLVYSGTTNGGSTWTAAAPITSRASNQGSVGWVGADGRLHVVWETYGFSRNSVAYAVRSGSKFGATRLLATIDDVPSPFEWAGSTGFRTNSFPAFALDGSILHVVWPNSNGVDADVLYICSTDAGSTWSTPVAIVDDLSDQFFPWVAARDGVVAVSYLDHNGETGSSYHASMVTSADGGATWSMPIRLSTKSSDPSAGNLFKYPDCIPSFIGDYTGIALGADRRAHPFWMDIRVGNSPGDPVSRADQDPYTASVVISQ
ncbi:MAG: exo-alpha-sialidase [Acidobacteria bacterium]|nr:exo-alpha-sialidase [Acidobacteriota bacterium]